MKDYNIIIVPLGEKDGGGFAGFVPDLPGCMSDGETRVEAIKNTEDAIAEWIATQVGRELAVPKAGSYAKFAKAQRDKLTKILESLVQALDRVYPRLEELDSRVYELERDITEIKEILENVEERETFDQLVGIRDSITCLSSSQKPC